MQEFGGGGGGWDGCADSSKSGIFQHTEKAIHWLILLLANPHFIPGVVGWHLIIQHGPASCWKSLKKAVNIIFIGVRLAGVRCQM